MSSGPESPNSKWASASSSSDSEPAEGTFLLFTKLPPEIRYKIYLAAVPSPGINFFNVHSFPNDHHGANRSTSPPSLHLDLRRLRIYHEDAKVASYDPSAWQARHALRQTCHEARTICAIPDDKIVRLMLSKPKRGLFVHAGDGLQRSMTPLQQPLPEAEPTVCRQVEVHADDIVSLSVENCSFNIVFEESTMFHVGRDDDEDEVNLGWAYDPQFRGGSSLGIPSNRFCLNLARDEWAAMRVMEEIAPALFEAATGAGQKASRPLDRGFVMLDTGLQTNMSPVIDDVPVFWDRWDDCYVAIPWVDDSLLMRTELVKAGPEKKPMRARYLRSALLRSPKRPRQFYRDSSL
jgi:hypothetical protein